MQILTPEDAKKGSSIAEDELRARVRDLSAEEKRLVSSVNSLRTEEKSGKERVAADMEKFRAEAKVERDRLFSEVNGLEARRAEALKPIEAVRAEAEERNQRSKDREDAVARREQAAKDADELQAEALERIHDRQQELDERSKSLDVREAGIKGEEKSLAESEKRLVGKWAEYHATVEILNERTRDLEQREGRASSSEKANEIRAAALDDREKELAGRERLLRSNYQALGEAKKHLGIQ